MLIEVTNPELAENLPGAELVTEGQYEGFYRIPREVLPEKGYEYVNIYTNEQGEEVKGSPYEVSTAVTEVDDLMNGKYLSKETSENPGFIPEVEVNDQTVIRSSEYYTKRLEEIHEKLQNKDLTDEERKNLLVSQKRC